MSDKPKWTVRLQRWPFGVVGEFLGKRSSVDPQGRAARRWIRRLLNTQAEQLALTAVLMDKGLFSPEEYERALQRAARQLCRELEEAFPGIKADENGVTIDREAIETMKDWPR